MATFIKCDFHGTEPNEENYPLNIELVQFIEAYPSRDHIVFHFEGSDTVTWYFENADTRNMEYDRILDLFVKE